MNLAEYAGYDALGLAELVAMKQVSAKELALTAVAAKEKVDPAVRSVVELYPDRIDLGLGRAPGTDQITSLALRRRQDTTGEQDDFLEVAEIAAAGHRVTMRVFLL